VRPALALAVAALTLLLGAAPAAAFDADEMYEPGAVVAIDLTLPPASVAALEADPEGDYVEGTFSLAPTDGTPGGIGAFSAPIAVGIRLKGEATFRGLDGKAAFKLKFNQFVKGQKFLGLKKMTLNNMLQDPSMVHEALAYQAFRAAGVPAPRTGYADVRLNGVDYGMHLNLETPDDVALKRIFGDFEAPPQHLYEGSYGADVVPGGAGLYEVDEGEEDDRSDLEALTAAVAASSPPSFSERMATVADLDEMTRMWAVERYIGQWDGYSSGMRNNYYLYSDPEGVFRMLPWGTDQTWGAPQLGFGPPGPVLFEGCLADPECAAMYRAAMEGAEAAVTDIEPGAEAQGLAALLAPWQALEAAPRKPFDAATIAAAVADVGQFAAARPAQLARWLEPPEPQAQPASGGGDSEDADGNPMLSTRLPLNRAKLGRGVLLTWARAPGPGRVSLAAQIVTAAGPLRACVASGRAESAGLVALGCRLSPRVRRHLAARWLRLRMRVDVALDSGGTATRSRRIRLARTESTAASG
jgi:hypothetical protein